ncbi:HYR domain-containing protein [Lutibacter sp.]|uniref:HYR-like domain-containing protein n=1 Tax=Lutibacter sp. TaxID=1925666 RepID=UPI00273473AA|nr:HYR domain-containing protein [Lutibacter sp.]MDP3313100.1 HYR domain-containing protein [Lutibacter sp.]
MNFLNNFTRNFASQRISNPLGMWLTVMLTVLMSFNTWAQTVSTDKDDYAPGETVLITGSGFLPGEKVSLLIIHIDPNFIFHLHDDMPDALVDEDGNFTSSWFVLDEELNTTLYLTAVGQTSGFEAFTVFTDADKHDIYFQTSGLSNNTSIEVSWSGTSDNAVAFSGTTIFNSPGPTGASQKVTTQANTSFTFNFPIISGYTLTSSKTSPFTTGVKNGSTVILATYTGCTAPAITTTYSNISVNNTADQCGAVVTYAAAAVTGSPTPTVTYSKASGTLFPVGTTTVTVTATNSCGSVSKTFDVIVADTENPTISAPSTVVVSTDAGICTASSVALGTATFADNCSGSSVSNNAPAIFPKGNTTVIWTVTDASGNTATANQTVTVNDTEAPVVSAPNGSSTIQCYYRVVTMPTPPTATDNCSGTINGVLIDGGIVDTPSPLTCEGNRVYTFKYTDAAGNTSYWTYTYNVVVQDFTLPSNGTATVECASAALAASVTLPVAKSSDCSESPAIVATGPVTNKAGTDTFNGYAGTISYTWTYTDCSGRFIHDWTYTYTVNDVTPPTAICKNISINLSSAGAASIVAADINNGSSDGCGAAVTLSASKTSFDCTNLGANTVVLTVTDASGNSSTCDATVTVNDVTPPTAICKNISINLSSAGAASIVAADINNGSSDGCGAAVTLSASKTSFDCTNLGANTVVLTVTDASGNFSTCNATVTVEGYAVIDTQPVSVNIVYGCDAPNLTVAASLVGSGTITYQWYKNTTNSNSGGTSIPDATSTSYQTPHNYSIGNYYYYVVVTANSCSVASTVATVTITPQIASAVGNIYYTGPTMAWTTSATSNTATVTLSATIKNGEPCGDIRTARVTFTVNGQRISSATNLPVGFIDPNNPAMGGTASAIVQLNIANTATSDLFEIGVIISGNYINGTFPSGVVTIIKPKPGGVIAGGTPLCNDKSTGYVKGFGMSYLNFFVEYAMKGKSITNPKGKVSLTVASYNKPDGTVDNKLHFYLIKSNAIASLNITSPTATFSGKANIAEIVGGNLIPIEGNCQMVLDLRDNDLSGNSNSIDLAGITIQRNGGGIWYSNNWESTKTVARTICDGDISVAGAPAVTTSAKTAEPEITTAPEIKAVAEELVAEAQIFNVMAYPNPSADYFTLKLQGKTNEEAIEVNVFDVLGRQVYSAKGRSNETYQFGARFQAGMYVVNVVQGTEKVSLRVIKH